MTYKTKHSCSFYSDYESNNGLATAFGNKLIFPGGTEVEILIKYGETKKPNNYRIFCQTKCGYVAWLDMVMVISDNIKH